MAGFEITENAEPLHRLASSLGADIQQALDEVLAFIEQRAKALAPVRTGALRDSISVLREGWTILINVGAPYASFIEYGRTNAAAQPFLAPAIEEGARMLVEKIAALLNNARGL